MRLITATQAIVPRKARVPLALTVALFHHHASRTASRKPIDREPIAAERATFLSPSTGVHTQLRRLDTVLRMPRHTVHKRRHQASHALQIDLLGLTTRPEDLIKQRSQIHPVWRAAGDIRDRPFLRSRLPHAGRVQIHINIVCTDLLVPLIPPPPVITEAWIPLGDNALEEVSKLLLQRTLRLPVFVFGLQDTKVDQRRLQSFHALSIRTARRASTAALDIRRYRHKRQATILHIDLIPSPPAGNDCYQTQLNQGEHDGMHTPAQQVDGPFVGLAHATFRGTGLVAILLHSGIYPSKLSTHQLTHRCARQNRPALPQRAVTLRPQRLHKHTHVTSDGFRRQVSGAIHVRLHTLDFWTRRAHTEPVVVRISSRSCLEARHRHVRGQLRMFNDSRHNDSHDQLRPERQHLRHQIGIISGEQEPLLLIALLSFIQSGISQPTPRVHALHVVGGIILAIHRPPERRVPS